MKFLVNDYSTSRLKNIDLNQLSWLVGNWQEEKSGDILEENWQSLLVDSLVGTFRWKKNNDIYLYEFMLIQKVEDEIFLKIKHFDKFLKGWEPKDKSIDFVLSSLGSHKAVFIPTSIKSSGWLIYELKNESTLIFSILDGNKIKEMEFVFSKK